MNVPSSALPTRTSTWISSTRAFATVSRKRQRCRRRGCLQPADHADSVRRRRLRRRRHVHCPGARAIDGRVMLRPWAVPNRPQRRNARRPRRSRGHERSRDGGSRTNRRQDWRDRRRSCPAPRARQDQRRSVAARASRALRDSRESCLIEHGDQSRPTAIPLPQPSDVLREVLGTSCGARRLRRLLEDPDAV